MDKVEILKLLEEWRSTGIRSMRYQFSKWILAGINRDEILKWSTTQSFFDLLRRTKMTLKEGAGKMNKTKKVLDEIKEKEAVEQRRKFNDMLLQEFTLAFEDLTQGGEGPIHMQKIADKMGKSLQHVRNLVNGGQLDSLVIKKPRCSELWRRK